MTLLVAHRGDPLLLRENTLPSVASAIGLGADWVEIDVRLTRDGVPVLLHDETLTRLWGHDLRVDALSHAELDGLAHDGGWRIPTLRQALELAADSGVPLMVDVPAPSEARVSVELVRSMGLLGGSVFTGVPAALVDVRAAAPEAAIAMSWESVLPPRAGLMHRVRPQFFNPHHRLLTRARVARIQRRGLKVSTWTVDDPQRMAALASAGVDAIISNDIRALRTACARAVS